MAKANALDYIIVHEMCHMYHKNRSKEFWELVASVMPDYEIRKEWLRNYGVGWTYKLDKRRDIIV